MIARYVPLLKGKAGEFDALENVRLSKKYLMTPLIDIPQMGPESSEIPSRSLDDYLRRKADRVDASWACVDRALFIDLYDTAPSARMSDGAHPVFALFAMMRKTSTLAIPVTGLDRDADHHAAVRQVATADARGACIRLLRDDLLSAQNLADQTTTLLETLGVSRKQADLVFDLRKVNTAESTQVCDLVARVANALPGIEEWRSVTFAASNMPQSLREDIAAGTVDTIDRLEFLLWTELRQRDLKRVPGFGDYGIVHPELVHYENPKTLNVSASIKYTLPHCWLIARGYSLRHHEDGWNQFYDLSRVLADRQEFRGEHFSWGDEQVDRRARRVGGPGSPTTWIAAGTNHHLTLVASQIAALP